MLLILNGEAFILIQFRLTMMVVHGGFGFQISWRVKSIVYLESKVVFTFI